MKKFLKRFRTVDIDVFVYRRTDFVEFDPPNFEYKIKRQREKKRWSYIIRDKNTLVHRSYLYDTVFLLNVINKKGPVIGDCYTNIAYRGQSIYPFVINKITNDTLESGGKEVFIVVNQDNISSIKGIEKASFVKFASINAKRWLLFYKDKHITYFNS